MKKLLLLAIASTLSFGVWALPNPKNSCQAEDLQARYARLFAAGNTCGKNENSSYAIKVSDLFIKDQERCKISFEEIDPNEDQINEAFEEIEQLPKAAIQSMCSSLDTQIQSIR